MIEDKMFPQLESLLSWTSKRQQALSANIANMDTPGYKAKDYSFAEQLSTIGISTTSGKHIEPTGDDSHARMFETNTKVKQNGNSVDLERELTEVTKNGLQYIALVQYLNQKMQTLRSAINDGGRI